MDPYATDSNERKSIPILIAVLSVIAALTLGGFLEWTDFTIPWWFDSPAIIGFYGIFYYLFNKLLWKWKIFQKVRLVKLPNLNGTWKGYVTSSYDDHSKKYETTFTIQQDWNKIRIFGEFKMSQSYSLTASILIDDKTGITISYNYMNEPSPQAIIVNVRIKDTCL